MPIRLELVFDLTQNRNATRPLQERYATALDMAAWADQAGFQAINFGEHHNNEFNYLSSPLLMGAAAGARTRNIQLRMILLTPFYHPLRLAEDLEVMSMQTDHRAFAVVSPEQCIVLAESLGDTGRLRIQALPTGIAPKPAWASLELFEKKVLPYLDVKVDKDMAY